MNSKRNTLATVGLTVAILTLAGCGATAVPDSPEAREKAATALASMAVELGSFERLLDRGAEFALDYAVGELELELGREVSDDERAKVAQILRSTLSEFMTAEMWSAQVAKVYAEHFTADELTALIAFYGSPTGRKALELEAAMTEQVDEGLDESLNPRMEEFIDRVDQEMAATFEGLDDGAGS